VANILVYTGSPGIGISVAAAAEAARAADAGKRTLLFAYRSTVGLSALLGVPVGSTPTDVAPRFEAMALDTRSELAAAWNETRATLPPPFSALAGDELPQPPASDAAFALLRLRELAPKYERIVVDAGPHHALIEALGVPDNLRWIAKWLIGLDGQPAQGPLLPGMLLPPEFTSNMRRVLNEAERLRSLLDAPASSVCYVLRPDAAALAEARLAIPPFNSTVWQSAPWSSGRCCQPIQTTRAWRRSNGCRRRWLMKPLRSGGHDRCSNSTSGRRLAVICRCCLPVGRWGMLARQTCARQSVTIIAAKRR
jgi:hypothetical protein